MLSTENDSIYIEVAKFFVRILHIEVPSATTDLFKSGILDSQNFIELLVHLERKFDASVGLDDLELDNFRCIETIVNFVSKRRNSAKVQP